MDDRRLRIMYRRVPAQDRETHSRLWRGLADAASARDAKAWRFAAERDSTLVVEFIEFAEASGLLEDPAVEAASAALADRFPALPRTAPPSEVWRPIEG